MAPELGKDKFKCSQLGTGRRLKTSRKGGAKQGTMREKNFRKQAPETPKGVDAEPEPLNGGQVINTGTGCPYKS